MRQPAYFAGRDRQLSTYMSFMCVCVCVCYATAGSIPSLRPPVPVSRKLSAVSVVAGLAIKLLIWKIYRKYLLWRRHLPEVRNTEEKDPASLSSKNSGQVELSQFVLVWLILDKVIKYYRMGRLKHREKNNSTMAAEFTNLGPEHKLKSPLLIQCHCHHTMLSLRHSTEICWKDAWTRQLRGEEAGKEEGEGSEVI